MLAACQQYDGDLPHDDEQVVAAAQAKASRPALFSMSVRNSRCVVVLDQLSRDLFCGTAAMRSGDDRALRAAREGIERGVDRELLLDERVRLYMPFVHSEALEDRERCPQLFAALRDELGGAARPLPQTIRPG